MTIDRARLGQLIDLYRSYHRSMSHGEWHAFYTACEDLCPGSRVELILPSLVQALELSGLLTVERLYSVILVSELWTRQRAATAADVARMSVCEEVTS